MPEPAATDIVRTAPLAGKAALITGAARRVGAAITRALHAAGASVVLHYRSSAQEADALARDLNAVRPGSATLLSCDLLDGAAVKELGHAAAAAFGGLDILVNNASSFYPTPLGDIGEDDWNDLVGTNLADIHGMRPLRGHPVYCVAKAGLIMLTKSLARELGPQVRVNAIAPGPVMWPEGGVDAALQEEIIARTALKRTGSPEDVARAVLFFATAAPFVTGQILAVDGGRSIGW